MMENLFNDLVSDIINKESPDKAKLERFKREWNAREQSIVAQKILYKNNHETPRNDRTDILNEYVNTTKLLRSEYTSSSPTTSKLHKWLKHVSNIPVELMKKPSNIYTFSS